MADKTRRNIKMTTRSTEEWLSQTLPLDRDEAGLDYQTGDVRMGPGMWATRKGTGALSPDIIVDAVATSNVTIATAFNVGDSVGGLELTAGMKVLAMAQSTGHQNGIYDAGASPARTAAFNTWDEHIGKVVFDRNAFKYYVFTIAAGGTLNTTAITVKEVQAGALRRDLRSQIADLPAVTTVADDSLLIVELADGTLAKISGADLITQIEAL